MKRLLSVILVIIMICSTFAGMQISSNGADLPSGGQCGENVYYTFDSETGLLTISGNGEMYNFSSSSSPFYHQESIKTVNIESGVTNIGVYAFCACSMTSITIPDSVTSIGRFAFVGCRGLISIIIPDSVTSIGYSAFYDCRSLESITIPDSVTSIGGSAFCDCSSLESITIPDSVTSIVSGAFSGCSSLESITIPDSVTSIGGYAFCGCTGLTSIDIPDSVTKIDDYAFHGCTGLTSIIIPNSVTEIGDKVFYRCENLKEITLSNIKNVFEIEHQSESTEYKGSFYGLNVEKINFLGTLDEWFSRYLFISAKSINFNGKTYNEFELNQEVIKENAFKENVDIQKLVLSSSVKEINVSAFNLCPNLKQINMPYNIDSCSGGKKTNKFTCFNASPIEKLIFNDEPTEITDKFNPIFQFETLKEFEVPDSVNYIGDAAFKDCKNLISITVPKSVTRIEYNAFSGCTNLTVRCYKDSYAETFCKWAGIPFEVIEEPHTHEYTDVVTMPTCTEQGYTTHTCECGDVLVDTYVDYLGHDYVANIVTPKANAVGYTHYKCSRCSDLKKDEAGNIIKDTFTAPTGKPAGFKCASRTATAEKFTWTKTSGVSGYQVQLLNSAGKSAGLKALTTNSYTFSKLASAHAYKARVRFYIKAADGKNYYGAWTTINSPTLPKGTTLTSLARARKAFTAKWKKGACTGYQLQYATNNKFSGAKTVTIKKVGTLKYTISKLAAKKTYYVRVRTYKTMNKVNYYSAWSAAKAVKTK